MNNWALTASGTSESPEDELDGIDILRIAVRAASATTAMMSTEHHGLVDLLAPVTPQMPE